MKKFNELMEKIGDKEDFFFVQIGSNDGKTGNDPIYDYIKKYGWSGILVEPVPSTYENLRKNYEGCDNLTFRNVAIADEVGVKKFFYVNRKDECGVPLDTEIGSFREDIIRKHSWIPNFDKYFSEMDVETTTFDLLTANVDHIDLLHIDAEGYDFEIIKTINFDRITPSMILYEHTHLAAANGPRRRRREKHARVTSMKYLNGFGYECHKVSGYDTLAVNKTLERYM